MALTAEKRWRKVLGFKRLPDAVQGIRFQDCMAGFVIQADRTPDLTIFLFDVPNVQVEPEHVVFDGLSSIESFFLDDIQASG